MAEEQTETYILVSEEMNENSNDQGETYTLMTIIKPTTAGSEVEDTPLNAREVSPEISTAN